jgi:NADPH-dependent curcumin reductase CurA
MTAAKNRQILLAARPLGEPTPDDFRLVEAEVPEPGPGQMLLRTVYLSLDPYMRGRMNAGPSYAKAVEVNEVMEGGTASEVVRSNLPQMLPNVSLPRAKPVRPDAGACPACCSG